MGKWAGDPETDPGRWDHSDCEGSPACPPRCPRFFDSDGTALLVQPYEPAHWDALVKMYADIDAYSRTLGLPPASMEATERWLDHLAENGTNLVALDESSVVGHVCAVPAGDEELQLVVFVHHDYQNSGLGTELVKHLVAHASADGYEGLELTVSAGNRRAICVYENVGFEATDPLAAELQMTLSLDAPVADRVQRPPAERE